MERDSVPESSNILFPVGSEKGKILCNVIDIDSEEDTKFFDVLASITSPSGAKIGGNIASTTDSITVKLIDPCSSEFNQPII